MIQTMDNHDPDNRGSIAFVNIEFHLFYSPRKIERIQCKIYTNVVKRSTFRQTFYRQTTSILSAASEFTSPIAKRSFTGHVSTRPRSTVGKKILLKRAKRKRPGEEIGQAHGVSLKRSRDAVRAAETPTTPTTTTTIKARAWSKLSVGNYLHPGRGEFFFSTLCVRVAG